MFENELEAFEGYRELFAAKNPPPVQKRAVSWRDIGFLYVLKMTTIIAAVLLAGFRTAEQFYLSAATDGVAWVGWAEAVLAVLAIEGFLVSAAADRARKNQHQTPWLINLGVVLALVISLLAGLGQSFRLLDIEYQNLISDFTLYLAIGLASASVIAWIAGETLGQELAWIDIENEKLNENYERDMEEWQNSLERSWNVSAERKAIRGKRKVSESFRNLPEQAEGNGLHWRTLPDDEKIKIVGMSVQEIMKNYGVIERTARNWLSYAERDFE